MDDFAAFLLAVGGVTLFCLGCRLCDYQDEKERDEFIRWEIERDSVEADDE